MAKEKKNKGLEKQGKEDEKKEENHLKKERLLLKVEEAVTDAIEEVKKDEGKAEGIYENHNSISEEITKEQEVKPDTLLVKPPSPPEELLLKVFMHCKGCAKKVRKNLLELEGVEDVKTDCQTNTVVVKGKKAAQDPEKVAEALYRKSGKRVEIISPAPAPVIPENVAIVEILEKKKKDKSNDKKESQKIVVAELEVCMHCEACAEQLKRRILKLSGVEGVETTLGKSQVKVMGSFDPDMLVKFIYKRTGKQASIVKQEQIPAAEKPAADAKPVNNSKPEKAKANEKKEEKTEEKPKEENTAKNENIFPTEIPVAVDAGPSDGSKGTADQHNYYYYPRYPMEYAYPYPYPYSHPHPNPQLYQYQYLYPTPPPPPPAPQIFSDENPNACIVM